MVNDQEGTTIPSRILKASSYNSGSDSWDPLQATNQVNKDGSSFSSKDADSRAQLGGEEILKQTQINEEDLEMGGEGGGGKIGADLMGEEKMFEEEGAKEGVFAKKEVTTGDPAQMEGRPIIVISDDSEEGSKKGRAASSAGSKGTTKSVPPGFPRIHGGRPLNQAGASSPFGKLQKGGFRFLKRSSSGASSGDRVATAGPAKKTKPISALPSQSIGEVAKNVGVAKPLSEDQIASLKSMEEERASS